VATSKDAGRFVCNSMYYQSLRACRQANSRRSLTCASGGYHIQPGPCWRGSGRGPRSSIALGGSEHAGGERWSSLFVHVPEFSAVPEVTQLKFLARLMELLTCC